MKLREGEKMKTMNFIRLKLNDFDSSNMSVLLMGRTYSKCESIELKNSNMIILSVENLFLRIFFLCVQTSIHSIKKLHFPLGKQQIDLIASLKSARLFSYLFWTHANNSNQNRHNFYRSNLFNDWC